MPYCNEKICNVLSCTNIKPLQNWNLFYGILSQKITFTHPTSFADRYLPKNDTYRTIGNYFSSNLCYPKKLGYYNFENAFKTTVLDVPKYLLQLLHKKVNIKKKFELIFLPCWDIERKPRIGSCRDWTNTCSLRGSDAILQEFHFLW